MEKQATNGYVLLVDDEPAILEALGELLDSCGFTVSTADGYDNAVKVLTENKQIEAIISDLKMPGKSGVDVLKYVNSENLEIPLIFLTGFGTLESCQEAVKAGAFDYILKPIDDKDKVVFPLTHAIEKRRLEQQTKEMQMDIIQMAEEHQQILDGLLADAEMKEKVQERISKVLEKWDN